MVIHLCLQYKSLYKHAKQHTVTTFPDQPLGQMTLLLSNLTSHYMHASDVRETEQHTASK